MIRALELKSGIFDDGIDVLLEQIMKEENITREKLIDIKYAREGGASFALIIFEE